MAYDLGTTLVKAALVAFDGTIVGCESLHYKTYCLSPGCAEQEPEEWWECICKITRSLVQAYPEHVKEIAAIGICGHMLGCLPVNAAGEPLRRAMIHADSRAVEQKKNIDRLIGASHLYSRTGGVLDQKTTLCKVLWIKDNEPEIYAETARFLQAKDYLIYRLTGNLDSTDFSDASHAELLDIHTGRYLDAELAELGIDVGKFPAVHKSTDVVGTLQAPAARALNLRVGIPVAASGGDGACANVGAGICRPGDIYCSLGTTAWIACNADKPVMDPKQRVFNIVSLDGQSVGVFGTMQTAGKSVEWAKDVFGLPSARELDQGAARTPPGSAGMIFLPYLEGERSPIFDNNARGVFFGLNSRQTSAHFMRAVLEGVAFALRSILDVYREKANITSMRIIGGGVKSRLWCQIIADVCDIHLETIKGSSDSITSIGAAFAAGVAVGAYKNIVEATAQIETDRTILPDPQNRSLYDGMYAKFKDLYPNLKDIY
ncbi:MAG: FGGY-family carbohydrate kinase [Candidatus Pelethousia sp.]|nr:FGGY-family carbohydrate kinase [Candidatus Pelethousia sp.]